ncbi:MAG: DUF1232 domain-containing protein [Burkholderiales bacterium]|nr:DUF1232 domain-containing protein [Burkholderiales bacterium]
MLERLRAWARTLLREVFALWFACRDPRTPRAAKLLAMLIVAYALSPIDLIPDFIPLLGYLDELILLPAAIYLVLKLMPAHVLEEARRHAAERLAQQRPMPRSYVAAAVIVVLWLLLLWTLWRWLIVPAATYLPL